MTNESVGLVKYRLGPEIEVSEFGAQKLEDTLSVLSSQLGYEAPSNVVRVQSVDNVVYFKIGSEHEFVYIKDQDDLEALVKLGGADYSGQVEEEGYKHFDYTTREGETLVTDSSRKERGVITTNVDLESAIERYLK